MKKIFLLFLSIFWVFNIFSQKESKYCELVGFSKFLSTKVIVVVDSGQGITFEMIKDTVDTYTPIETKNEKYYINTTDKTFEGKIVQTDEKGAFIWKKVESGGQKIEKNKAKIKTFSSMVEGMNFMDENGWEFVQAYVVTSVNQNVYRWILKKAK